MKIENDELLCRKYPKIFADRFSSSRETAMCWGFECGDGWFNIIDSLCKLIQDHVDRSLEDHRRSAEWNRILFEARAGNLAPIMQYYHKLGYGRKEVDEAVTDTLAAAVEERELEPVEQVVATQVKEKYGGLRFYFVGGDSYVEGAVRMAEQISLRTCEECGGVGRPSSGGWISVRCDKCR